MGSRRFLTGFSLALLLSLFLWGMAAPLPPVEAAERSWLQIQYDPDVSAQTRIHIEAAADLVADMLTEYRLSLRLPITVLVTADQSTYEKVLQQYGYSLESARQTAQHTAGVSLGKRPVILLKGTPALQANRAEVYRVLPHEIFHQVQNQFGHQTTANWMVEAAPELFQVFAREKAGLEEAAQFAQKTRIDALAVGCGNHLGAIADASLDFERLGMLRQMVQIPLVMHGGAGLQAEEYRRLIQSGIAKINIATDTSTVAAEQLKKELSRTPHMNYVNLMAIVKKGVKESVRKYMLAFECISKAKAI